MAVKTDNEAVDKALRPIEADLARIKEHPLFRGVYLDVDLVTGTPKRITHGLGRPWQGWFVTRNDADTGPYEVNRSSTDRKRELWLQAGGNVSLTIYLF